ncbi:hypothetical protein N7462_011435 [Penicillium macrosclerotiorum]|uniref:uncharacterized protein n=1 Tax=Penicillium macrosclerotiorum TaxID=303699 RepID=UPI002548CD9E|nr:uncharacterized protein N7462_011435 [Penicillium macrosclerotiorum]KAJ5664622.1 hypothetical protein N7462_011435 [Penicillium macrosclerotiorum]
MRRLIFGCLKYAAQTKTTLSAEDKAMLDSLKNAHPTPREEATRAVILTTPRSFHDHILKPLAVYWDKTPEREHGTAGNNYHKCNCIPPKISLLISEELLLRLTKVADHPIRRRTYEWFRGSVSDQQFEIQTDGLVIDIQIPLFDPVSQE